MSNGRPHGGVGSGHIPGRGIRSVLDVRREMEDERRKEEEERRDEEERKDRDALDSYDFMSDKDRERVNRAVEDGMTWREAIEYIRDIYTDYRYED